MKIAILGNGGREHAIHMQYLNQKKQQKFIVCLVIGTEYIAKNINVDLNNFQQIYEFIKKKSI